MFDTNTLIAIVILCLIIDLLTYVVTWIISKEINPQVTSLITLNKKIGRTIRLVVNTTGFCLMIINIAFLTNYRKADVGYESKIHMVTKADVESITNILTAEKIYKINKDSSDLKKSLELNTKATEENTKAMNEAINLFKKQGD